MSDISIPHEDQKIVRIENNASGSVVMFPVFSMPDDLPLIDDLDHCRWQIAEDAVYRLYVERKPGNDRKPGKGLIIFNPNEDEKILLMEITGIGFETKYSSIESPVIITLNARKILRADREALIGDWILIHEEVGCRQ